MSIAEMREKLHNLINKADDKKIQGMYLLFEDELDDAFHLSDDQINILNEDRAAYLKSEGQSYSWPDAKNIIKGR